ncbi:trimethylamine methyltransferase family protein [Mesorhizobium tianshanense]|nr:trimethylamine methyltransferase family protein [Mesorhizobium tianshanense]
MILEEIGIEFRDDPESVELLRGAGAERWLGETSLRCLDQTRKIP